MNILLNEKFACKGAQYMVIFLHFKHLHKYKHVDISIMIKIMIPCFQDACHQKLLRKCNGALNSIG